MTQRQITHEHPLPACRAGHTARHIFDNRCAAAGGGHFIECLCASTPRFPDLAPALKEWMRMQGKRGPYKKRPPAPARERTAKGNVVQMGLRLGGGARHG